MTRLMTYDEVAERLSVSKRQVERIVSEGAIRPIYIGSAPRVTDRELEAYIAHLEDVRGVR